jgi:hypothetical protein
MGALLFDTKPANATIEAVKDSINSTVEHSEL